MRLVDGMAGTPATGSLGQHPAAVLLILILRSDLCGILGGRGDASPKKWHSKLLAKPQSLLKW